MLKQRIITGIILAIAFLGLLQWGGTPFALLIMALAVIGLYEFMRIHGYPAFGLAGWLGYIAIALICFPWFTVESIGELPTERFIWLFLFGLLALTVISKNKIDIKQAAVVLIGVLYIGIGFRYMTVFRLEEGLWWAYLIFGCTWITDIGAYFTGRAIGRHPLWPTISPNKTIEGALGGVFFSIALAMLLARFLPDAVGLGQAALIGLVISIAGQFGDLIQSAYKRVHNVKDSGTIFPGHGGVLDRCDSWLIVFPILSIVLGMMGG